MAAREGSDLQSRAHKILGLQSASASRVQSLGAISGGYAMALQMNEAQRQATTGMIEQSQQQQQVVGILADRSFGQRSAGIQASREERDLLNAQAQQNTSTIVGRTLDVGDQAIGGLDSKLLTEYDENFSLHPFPITSCWTSKCPTLVSSIFFN